MISKILKKEYCLSDRVIDLDKKVFEKIKKPLERIEETYRYNQLKVLAAFRECKIREPHFAATTGYGYDDLGRDAIDELYAMVFGCEDALVRHSIVSGTHALTLCLFGVLRPGDRLVSVTGNPYDTLKGVISSENTGSLADFGISYSQIELKNNLPDLETIKTTLPSDTKAVLIQRSKGYDWRNTLSVSQIGEIISTVKSVNPEIICIVDNCYGEFTETIEPTHVGADLMAGSLIKNPGGGIARGGAYIAGKQKFVELTAYKLNCVGQGKDVGPSLGMNREILQGFFMAPHITAEAVKVALFCSGLFSELGFEVCPTPEDERGDIIQAIKFGNPDLLIAFCQGIQKGAPIDSFATPVPSEMPGYDCDIIMAAGAFTQGATTELSADAPIREPYVAYMQGSLDFECGRVGVLVALQNMIDSGLI